jgi:hypothetical protein
MEHRPSQDAQKAHRKRRRTRQANSGAVCVRCGKGEAETALVDHHVVGRANDKDLTAPHCLSCHAEADEALRVAGINLRHDVCRTGPERLADMLTAVGGFLIQLGQTLCNWARELLAFVQTLDTHCPEWRALSGAHE